ncbi:hypothetical protein, unlikely [Trypanosoma brucei gambiense DAL972]|uniref:Uncharacterized protein n=1 Tax=Trypanosoma brucei gambiense (strain MHOM/CI/86/DAL972) TaxID=679716 RepID=D0A7G1_TRYB9|nr:hypothetical protein, unlikely [Trypanosoma brucei gambiense DAL972]CBH17612.1 hypothetical protein, unlikely [Trypanosoma brucei gambiense DAL972]|eukprot:XP_011779876.1 hypothetical protein, unlikely [Trypanosoma brucei gambiense DAL972]
MGTECLSGVPFHSSCMLGWFCNGGESREPGVAMYAANVRAFWYACREKVVCTCGAGLSRRCASLGVTSPIPRLLVIARTCGSERVGRGVNSKCVGFEFVRYFRRG